VENLVGYAKDDLMVPLSMNDPEPLSGATGGDLGQLNEAAAAWYAQVNAAVHSEICAVPAERLVTEQELLAALPSLRLEVGPKPITRKVDKLSCIRFASGRYSVPNALIGTTVTVLAENTPACCGSSNRSPENSMPNIGRRPDLA
jgi:hypothetical protein